MHDNTWSCRRELDCVLHSRCFLQIHKDYDACAPYPGPPNYQVPVVILDVYLQVDYLSGTQIFERASTKYAYNKQVYAYYVNRR